MFYSGFTNELIIRCVDCKKEIRVPCSIQQWGEYSKVPREKSIQNIFPEMSIENRETFISGMCSDCQEKFFESEDINELNS